VSLRVLSLPKPSHLRSTDDSRCVRAPRWGSPPETWRCGTHWRAGWRDPSRCQSTRLPQPAGTGQGEAKPQMGTGPTNPLMGKHLGHLEVRAGQEWCWLLADWLPKAWAFSMARPSGPPWRRPPPKLLQFCCK